MERNRYDVFYIDKFHNRPNADELRERVGRRFKLSAKALGHLSSGEPTAVKKSVSLQEAKRYLSAFRSVGGISWIQPSSVDGRFHERRQLWRRSLFDRRAIYRASSIQPDRRQSCGRRSTDMWRPFVDEL